MNLSAGHEAYAAIVRGIGNRISFRINSPDIDSHAVSVAVERLNVNVSTFQNPVHAGGKLLDVMTLYNMAALLWAAPARMEKDVKMATGLSRDAIMEMIHNADKLFV